MEAKKSDSKILTIHLDQITLAYLQNIKAGKSNGHDSGCAPVRHTHVGWYKEKSI
jgi:hypothetical protein